MKNSCPGILCSACPAFSKSIFKNADKSALSDIQSVKVMSRYEKEEEIFKQGNPILGIHCISKGKVKVSSINMEGKESIRSIAEAGDLLGHRHIFDESSYIQSSQALEESQICFIERKDFVKIADRRPEVYKNLIEKLGAEIEFFEHHGHNIMSKDARSRVASLILLMAKGSNEDQDRKIKINVSLTRTQMASMIGLASETMIRVLSEFKKLNIVEQSGKNIFILDVNRLEDLAHKSF